MARKKKKNFGVSIFSFVLDKPLTDDEFEAIGICFKQMVSDLVRDPDINKRNNLYAQILGGFVMNPEGLSDYCEDLFQHAVYSVEAQKLGLNPHMNKPQ